MITASIGFGRIKPWKVNVIGHLDRNQKIIETTGRLFPFPWCRCAHVDKRDLRDLRSTKIKSNLIEGIIDHVDIVTEQTPSCEPGK